MSTIFEALRQVEQEVQRRSGNATVAKGADRRDKEWEAIVSRAIQQTEMPDTSADAKRWGGFSLLKPRRIIAFAVAFLVLVTGAIATDAWLRPAGVITGQVNHLDSHHQATLQWTGPVTLRGEIAHGLNIEMQLVREGSKLTGSYFYERIDKDISVRGTIGEADSILLEEFVKERKTGVFTGKFVSAARMEGKWSRPGSTRSRDFFLVGTGLRNITTSHDQER